jgi:hypothetical protein
MVRAGLWLTRNSSGPGSSSFGERFNIGDLANFLIFYFFLFCVAVP